MSRYLKGSVVRGKSVRSGMAVMTMAVSASMPRTWASCFASSAFRRCCPWRAAAMYMVSLVPMAFPRSSYESPLASRAWPIFWSAAARSRWCGPLSAWGDEGMPAGRTFRHRLLLQVARALDEEMNDVTAEPRVLGLVDDVRPRARPRQLHLHDLGQPRLGAIGHE